jgi:amino acid adenylation domain-containing protein
MTSVRDEQDTSSEVAGSYAGSAAIPDLVAAQARNHPTVLALTANGTSLTYGELDRRANRLARHLRALGVEADVPVGLCLPRSLDMVIGALGILKAGGAYVPMDPAYPAERLRFMLDDAAAPIFISSPDLASRVAAATRDVVYMDAAEIAEQSSIAPSVVIPQGTLAYIIYTSGSTGIPKGVEVTHASLASLVNWHNHAFSATASDRASHVAGLGFDAAVWELWPYLVAGASVHMADDSTRNSPDLLRDWLLAQRITIGFVPTPLAERMLARCDTWPRGDLRIMLTGGDALRHFPPVDLPFSLINNYGPTECTVATSGRVLPQSVPGTLPSIGKPVSHAEIHLLNEDLRPVPPGSPGEMHIGGAGVARGYRNRPDITAERFIMNPFRDDSGSRLYKTGDLARWLPNGELEFLGRMDDQIKIRGYRIEPGEIECALNRHPDVSASLVTAREYTPGDKRLVAYVVPSRNAGATFTHSALRDFLRDVLPEYMLPATFVRLETLPVTLNGKIDRAALPAPDAANTVQDEAAELECTATEQRVAEIVGELLKLEEIGLDDNFFLLGGHSLLGAQLIARLRDAFGVEIGLRSLFEAPTVAALSAEVDRLTGTATSHGGR